MTITTHDKIELELVAKDVPVKDGIFSVNSEYVHLGWLDVEELKPLTYPMFFDTPNGKLDYCGYYLDETPLVFSFDDCMESVTVYEQLPIKEEEHEW